MKDLYEKFYEQERLKEVRGVLDGDDERKISEMVLKEGSAFTDYLNFFEFLAYLDGKANSHEGNTRDVWLLLEFTVHNSGVADYIANENNGFQELGTLLGPSRINHVFVYGTLLSHVRPASWDKGLPGPPETGWIWGKLYQVGEYPGALLSSPPTDMEPERAQEKVFGEIFRVQDADSTLTALDTYEDFFPHAPERSTYFRTVVRVHLNGREEEEQAWVYLYNGEPNESSRIPSGRYL
jgi:gamma-glutamylcyclotransferase (GGCT)/AIG2-like uncharacterized protein YtfP